MIISSNTESGRPDDRLPLKLVGYCLSLSADAAQLLVDEGRIKVERVGSLVLVERREMERARRGVAPNSQRPIRPVVKPFL